MELNGGSAQTMVFDPSTPYIYLPLADFTVVKTKINQIFSQFRSLDRVSVCDAYDGQCMIENSCNYVRTKLGDVPFGIEMTLTDEH